MREAFFGNTAAAGQTATAALTLSKGKEVEFGAAFAAALVGDVSRAQKLAQDLERRFPEDTSVKAYYVPALRAQVALVKKQPKKALEWLEPSIAYELGEPPSCFFGYFGIMYPVFVRGQAYLALHRGTQAVTEFQKIVNHRGIVISDPVGAVARLQLARAYLMAGDHALAKAAYSDFLSLWKDADPEIPLLKQAQSESAQLKR